MTYRLEAFDISDAERWAAIFTDGASTVTLTVGPGGEVTGFEVQSAEPLTAVAIRAVPFGQLADEARRLAWEQLGVRTEATVVAPHPPPKQAHPDLVYAALAVDYAAWVGSGTPIATLAEAHGLTVQGLRTRVAEARRRGFLTPAPPGRKGGTATDRAREIVKTGEIDGID